MAVDSASRWLQAAGRQPLLTPAEELHLGALIRAWQDHPAGPADAPAAIRRRGLKARDRMVSGNLRLVATLASRRPGPADLADLLQSGALGLIRAAEKFDPARGYKFSTYAYWWILQAIRPVHDATPLIRVPAPVAAGVRGEPGGSKSPELLAAGRAARRVLSLDSPIVEGGADLVEALAADAPGMAELEQRDAAEVALAALRAADPDAAALLELRSEGGSLRELAPLAGIRLKLLALELTEARARLRKVPEVAELLAG